MVRTNLASRSAALPLLPSPAATAQQLGTIEVLRVLSERARANLAIDCRMISAPKGGVLFAPYDPPMVYALLTGEVTILMRPSPESEFELFTRAPGQLLNEMTLFLGRREEEARAATAVVALRMEVTAVHAALVEERAAVLALAELLAKRAAAAEVRLSECAIHSVTRRLLLLLQHLAFESRVRDSRGAWLPEHLTHEELARQLGTSRVSVSQAMSRLRCSGEVAISGRRIILPKQSGAAEVKRDR